MKSSAIRRVFETYRGRDPRERARSAEYNRVAAKVAEHLQAQMAVAPENAVRVFESYRIAVAIGESSDLVHRIVFAMGGGSNGITCFNGARDEEDGGPVK